MKKFPGMVFFSGLLFLTLIVVGNALFFKPEKAPEETQDSNFISDDDPPNLYDKLRSERRRDNPPPCPRGDCNYRESTVL